MSFAEVTLGLSDTVERALAHSYQIQTAQYDSASADNNVRAAKAERFPTLSLNASSFYVDEIQTIDIPIPLADEMEIGAKENYQADFKLMVPLFTGGKIADGIDLQRATLAAQTAGLNATRTAIAYQSRDAYLRLMVADGLLRSAEASVDRVIIIRNDVRNLHASGLADSVDLLDAELAYQKGLYQFEVQNTARINAALALARLIGLENETDFTLTEEIPPPRESTYAEITVDDIQRQELAVYDCRIRAAEHGVRLNNAAYYPTLAAFGGYSVGKPNKDMFGNEWNDYFTAGLNLNWSFNLGNKPGKSTNAARQKVYSEQMARRDFEESLLLQANAALENIRHAYQVFIISEKELAIAREKYRLGRERQLAGRMAVSRLLELEQELTASEQMSRVAKITYYLSENALLYALGSPRLFGGLSQ